jgi:hypothetical protein
MSMRAQRPLQNGHRIRWLVLWTLAGIASAAHAHHSAAMFDPQQSVTLNGTVKQFQWSNPHCWIQVMVNDKSGPVEWSVEMGSPSQLYRGGWRPTILHAGEAIVVVVHPMRDGSKGGQFVSATHADGTPIEKPSP